MKNKYRSWYRKYKKHVSSPISTRLANKLLTQGYPQNVWGMSNKQEYKQIKVIKEKNLLVLTSMSGQAIKFYSLNSFDPALEQPQTGVFPVFEKRFEQSVVEIETSPDKKYCFFTLTDFGKSSLKDKVVCIHIDTFKTIFEIETKGKWSKFIAYHPNKLLVISNWHSNDLTIIDVKNIRKPFVAQLVPCGISPRGIAFNTDGSMGIVAGFYSRNLTFLKYNKTDRKFYIEKITEPFDFPNYSGNMRHVVYSKSKDKAFVSNMGRNLVHSVNLETYNIEKSFPVGTFPNTIKLSEDERYLAVSCRKSNLVCILNTSSGQIETLIDTGPEPTGLDFTTAEEKSTYNVYITNFADDTVLCKRVALE